MRLERDVLHRYVVYLAEWKNPVGASCTGVFERLDSAIFFVVSGLGSYIDWSVFPDPSKRYPNEDRRGTEDLSPVFRVEQVVGGNVVSGQVMRMSVADVWIVGNGIADSSRRSFQLATGRDAVTLTGAGGRLQGRL